MPPAVRLSQVRKVYDASGEAVTAIDGVSLEIEPGEFVALMGPSGCGKSTLLHIIGAMDKPTHGEVWIGETAVHALDEEALTRIRRTQVGFVFQFFHLLPTLTVEENVALPLLLAGRRTGSGGRVDALLKKVGLLHRRGARPQRLSGGEMQRTAIARAMVHDPPLLVADEPTGNLDSENGRIVLDLLAGLASGGAAVVMATHSESAAAHASRRLHLKDGRLSA